MNKLKNLFYYIFTILFIVLIINIIFRKVTNSFVIKNYIFVLVSFIVLFVMFILKKIIDKIFEKKSIYSYICIGTLLIIILGIVIYTINNFEIPFGWDFEYLTKQAKDWAYDGLIPIRSSVPHYLQSFPNNMFMYLVEICIFKFTKIFNIIEPFKFAVKLNSISILCSILFTFLYLKKRKSLKHACYSLIIFLMFIPLYLYIPIIYSDTLSIAFIPLLLYLSLFFEDENKFKRIFSVIFFMLFAFAGCKIKMTVVFIPLSIIISNLLNRKFKLSFSILGVFILFYLFLSLVFNNLILGNDRFHTKLNDYGAMPYTHWVMMGIDNPDSNKEKAVYGGYSGEDYIFSESFENNSEAKKANIKEIKRRIKSYGIIGYLNYLSKKAVICWGDGSYYSNVVIHWAGKYNLDKKFITGSDEKHTMYYVMCSIQYAMLILICFSFIRSIVKKDDDLLIQLLSVSMLLVFLLLWENRSRYLYNYIPIFVIIITCSINMISEDIKILRINKKIKK